MKVEATQHASRKFSTPRLSFLAQIVVLVVLLPAVGFYLIARVLGWIHPLQGSDWSPWIGGFIGIGFVVWGVMTATYLLTERRASR